MVNLQNENAGTSRQQHAFDNIDQIHEIDCDSDAQDASSYLYANNQHFKRNFQGPSPITSGPMSEGKIRVYENGAANEHQHNIGSFTLCLCLMGLSFLAIGNVEPNKTQPILSAWLVGTGVCLYAYMGVVIVGMVFIGMGSFSTLSALVYLSFYLSFRGYSSLVSQKPSRNAHRSESNDIESASGSLPDEANVRPTEFSVATTSTGYSSGDFTNADSLVLKIDNLASCSPTYESGKNSLISS